MANVFGDVFSDSGTDVFGLVFVVDNSVTAGPRITGVMTNPDSLTSTMSNTAGLTATITNPDGLEGTMT